MSGQLQIGSITSGYRPIRNGSEYNTYFPKPSNEDKIIIEDGEVDDTVELMKKVVWKYIDDTRKIAPRLKSNSKKQTCQNIWEFLYHHIQYKLDERGLEQLRRPARSWDERATGIDCDCFSIFCSSILTNLEIPHKFRITKYDSPNFQHVYVVIPNGMEEIIIDPVLSKFNYEKPYSSKKDFTMNLSGIDVAVLSGVNNDLENVLFGLDLDDELGATSEQEQLEAMYRYLVSTRNTLAQNPSMIQQSEDPQAFLKMLDYAIQYWNTDKREEALSILAMNEIDLNKKMGLSGESGLGAAKGFFQKVSNFAKTATQKVGTAVKAVAKTVVKLNPISTLARGGLLVAMKLNLKKMGSKLKWAYGTPEQAAKAGISITQYNNAKTALQKIENLYVSKLQGNKDALKNAIIKGKAGGLSGQIEALGELGEPISITASIAAATPVIIAAIKIMKDSGLFAKGEDTQTNNLAAEASIANGKAEPSTALIMQAQNPAPAAQSYAQPTGIPTQENTTETNFEQTAMQDYPITQTTTKSSFLKDNPIIVVAGLGAVGVAAYLLTRPKSKNRTGLSGVRKTTKRRVSNRSKVSKMRSKVRRVTIK